MAVLLRERFPFLVLTACIMFSPLHGVSSSSSERNSDSAPFCLRFDVPGRFISDDWVPYSCQLRTYTPESARVCLKNRRLHFIGNSIIYKLATTLKRFLDGEPEKTTDPMTIGTFIEQDACYNYKPYGWRLADFWAEEQVARGFPLRCHVLGRQSRNEFQGRIDNSLKSEANKHNIPFQESFDELLINSDDPYPITYTETQNCGDIDKSFVSAGLEPKNERAKRMYPTIGNTAGKDIIIANCGIFDILNSLSSSSYINVASILGESEMLSKGKGWNHIANSKNVLKAGQGLMGLHTIQLRNAPWGHKICRIASNSFAKLFNTFSSARLLFIGSTSFAFGRHNKNSVSISHTHIDALRECHRELVRSQYIEYLDLERIAVERLDTFFDHVHWSGPITRAALKMLLNMICNRYNTD